MSPLVPKTIILEKAMFRLRKRKTNLLLTILALLSCSLALFATRSAGNRLPSLSPAGQERLIERKKNSPGGDEPVQLTLVRTKRKADLVFGRAFHDDDEWIQGLTITATNTTRKPITYIKVYFSFERPNNPEGYPPLLHSLVYGTKVLVSNKNSKRLIPGKSIDLTLTDSSYSSLKRALRKLGYPASINRLQMYLSEVAFDDDTSWANGYWFRRDPADPQNGSQPFNRKAALCKDNIEN